MATESLATTEASVALDLFVQDFVMTNKCMNQHLSWNSLVNRQFLEDGLKKILSFSHSTSPPDTLLYAVATHIALPDTDWLRFELTYPTRFHHLSTDHRFDYLRMMSATTHTGMTVTTASGAVIVKLTTRHRGLVNIVFVIRDSGAIVNPFLV